jgi:acyl-CoA thioesterase-1
MCSSINSQCGEKSRLVSNLEAGKKQTVVSYGTSLSQGAPWVQQFSAELNRRYPGLATVIDSGQGAKQPAGLCKWGVDNIEPVILTQKQDTVFIEFAAWDSYLPFKTTLPQARSNLVIMIDHLLTANESCEIILMVMNPPTGVHLETRPKIEVYNQMYRDVARQRNLMLIDHWPNWQKILKAGDYAVYVPDGVHPNAEGGKEVIVPEIVKALGVMN